ncbi:MAG: riboflavin biosynthesis protein RibD, partial [Yaniella sp.]|nr:riboflavin biosynthesis protein RibD [Yaniella sp.]
MLSHTQLSSAMQRAITLAQRGPSDDINPQVGCVIIDGAGSIVAEGYHAGSGSDHAEVAALKNLDPQLNPVALTAVVTLEPCN